MKTLFSTILLWLLLATGAALAQEKTTGSPPQFSGFLGDYSKLQPATDREGVWNYFKKSNQDLQGYTKIMFDPVEVFITPNPDYKGVQPDVLKNMADRLLNSFRSVLTPDYQIVHDPGPDVLRIRAAITGVQLVKPPLGATDFLPLKAAFNLARSASGDAPMLVEMSAEMEVLDADGNRLAAAVATRKGDQKLKQGDQITWNDMQSITDYWAKSFRQRLDKLRDVDR